MVYIVLLLGVSVFCVCYFTFDLLFVLNDVVQGIILYVTKGYDKTCCNTV